MKFMRGPFQEIKIRIVRFETGSWKGDEIYSVLSRAGHRRQEFRIRLRLRKSSAEQLHGLNGRERIQHLAQNPDAIEFVRRHQEFFLARSRAVDIDSREDALVHQASVQI